MSTSAKAAARSLRTSSRPTKLLIDPEYSPSMARWDACSTSLLVTVSLLTPFEAGFLPCSEPYTPLWTANMFTTIFFVMDMILQFFLPYSMPTRFGRRLVVKHRSIIKNYLKTWFLIDFLSVVPWDMFSPCTTGEQKMNMGMFRAIRLLRLMKLLRLVRGLRMFRRWQADFGFSLRRWMLYQLLGMVLVVSHWVACALGVLNRIQGQDICGGAPENYKDGCQITWITMAQTECDFELNPSGELSPLDAYLFSFHASMSILVHPHTYSPTGPAERAFFSLLMLAGGFIWTQVISRSTATITSLNKHHIAYQTTMDDLNMLSAEKGLSHDMKRRLRKYFLCVKDASQHDTWQAIVRKMSPKLRRDCGREINKFWVLKVKFLSQCCNIVLITDIAEKLSILRYSETETFGELHSLYILMEGTVMLSRKTALVQTSGAVWGEDHLLLSAPELLLDNTAAALVFVMCQSLKKKVFEQIVANFPDQQPIIRRAVVKLAMIRGVKKMAAEMKEQKRLAEPEDDESFFWTPKRNSTDDLDHLDEHVQDALMVQSRRRKSLVTLRASSRMASKDLPLHPPEISAPAALPPLADRALASAADVDVLARRVEELVAQQAAMRELVETSFAALAEGLGELASSQSAGLPFAAQSALQSGVCSPSSQSASQSEGRPLPLVNDPGTGNAPQSSRWRKGMLHGNPLGACS